MIYRPGKFRSFAPKLYTTTAPTNPIPVDRIKWSWTGRAFDPRQGYWLVQQRDGEPKPGDVVLAQVKAIGLVDTIVTVEGERVQLYAGDGLIGVWGNPTALAMYEAEVAKVEPLHLVNKGGMVGTVRPEYCALLQPTQLTFLGYLANGQGQCLNLREILLQSKPPAHLPKDLLLVMGAGLGSSKSAVVVQLVKELLTRGLRVAVCRFLGRASSQAVHDLWATRAHHVSDFANYEFTTTHGYSEQDLQALFSTMLADAAQVHPDVVIVELGETILQREHQLLLALPTVQRLVSGVVLVERSTTLSPQVVTFLNSSAYQNVTVIHTGEGVDAVELAFADYKSATTDSVTSGTRTRMAQLLCDGLRLARAGLAT